jgi:hypothetical protein
MIIARMLRADARSSGFFSHKTSAVLRISSALAKEPFSNRYLRSYYQYLIS